MNIAIATLKLCYTVSCASFYLPLYLSFLLITTEPCSSHIASSLLQILAILNHLSGCSSVIRTSRCHNCHMLASPRNFPPLQCQEDIAQSFHSANIKNNTTELFYCIYLKVQVGKCLSCYCLFLLC